MAGRGYLKTVVHGYTANSLEGPQLLIITKCQQMPANEEVLERVRISLYPSGKGVVRVCKWKTVL